MLPPPLPGQWRRGEESSVPFDGAIPKEKCAVLPFGLQQIAQQSALQFAPATKYEQTGITVLLTTSHIPSHPSAWVLENVYNSIRKHLSDARIIILADGVDGEEPWEYREYKAEVKRRGWEILEFSGKHHQTLMMRHALLTPGLIETPLVMVGEHDWGLRARYVDWYGISSALLDPAGRFRLIQLRQDTVDSWEYGFLGDATSCRGIGLLPTTCYQFPMHVAVCSWYRRLLPSLREPNFLESSDEWTKVLEDTGAMKEMACYIPAGPMGRLYHLNGCAVMNPNELDGVSSA
jgi:hypothetical protein